METAFRATRREWHGTRTTKETRCFCVVCRFDLLTSPLFLAPTTSDVWWHCRLSLNTKSTREYVDGRRRVRSQRHFGLGPWECHLNLLLCLELSLFGLLTHALCAPASLHEAVSFVTRRLNKFDLLVITILHYVRWHTWQQLKMKVNFEEWKIKFLTHINCQFTQFKTANTSTRRHHKAVSHGVLERFHDDCRQALGDDQKKNCQGKGKGKDAMTTMEADLFWNRATKDYARLCERKEKSYRRYAMHSTTLNNTQEMMIISAISKFEMRFLFPSWHEHTKHWREVDQ